MPTYTRWFVAECPLKEECSKASWDRVKGCQSWLSEDDARAVLWRHLRGSSLHWHASEEDHEEIVKLTTVFVEDVECQDQPADEKAATKKRRKGDGGSSSHGDGVDLTETIGNVVRAEITNVLALGD